MSPVSFRKTLLWKAVIVVQSARLARRNKEASIRAHILPGVPRSIESTISRNSGKMKTHRLRRRLDADLTEWNSQLGYILQPKIGDI